MNTSRRDVERCMLEWMKRRTDACHPVNITEMQEILREEYGIEAKRRMVSEVLAGYAEEGYLEEATDVRDGRGSYFYYNGWDFDESELLLLTYSVMANNSIPRSNAENLINRICDLGGGSFRNRVENHFSYESNSFVIDNHQFFLNLELIHEAIIKKRKISFNFCRYGIDKKLHNESNHISSPYYVGMKKQKAYLVAFSEKNDAVVSFRIDHIKDIEILDEKRVEIDKAPGYDEHMDYKSSFSSGPYMFLDKQENIVFRADDSMIDQIIEWFGNAVIINKDREESQKVIASVTTSPLAMEYWAKQYLDKVEILSPPKLRERIYTSLKDNIEKYNVKTKSDVDSIVANINLKDRSSVEKNKIARGSRKAGKTKYDLRYSYCEFDSDYEKLSPSKLIERLFSSIDDDGILIVPERPYLTPKSLEGNKWLRCEYWPKGKENMKEAKQRYESMQKAISEIAAMTWKQDMSICDIKEQLSEEAYGIWRDYIKDFDNGQFEKDIEKSAIKLIDKELNPTPSNSSLKQTSFIRTIDTDPISEDEEIFNYWRHNYNMNLLIMKRTTSGNFFFDVCIRAKRLCYLMAFDAPEDLINRESKLLALYIMLEYGCVKYTTFETYDGYALPLEKIENISAVIDVISEYGFMDSEDVEKPVFEEIQYMKAGCGEEVISRYDNEFIDDSGCTVIATWLSHNKSLNPNGFRFEGLNTSSSYSKDWPDFIIFPDDPWDKSEDRSNVKEDEVLKTLKAAAKEFGIDEKLIGLYKVPL